MNTRRRLQTAVLDRHAVRYPNLITNVETTNAAASDDAVTSMIHTALEAQDLIPKIHVADTGFVNSALFVDAREHFGIDLVGPPRGDRQWQAQAGAGFAARDFAIDVVHQRAACPAGKTSQSWTPALARGTAPAIKVKFVVADCRACRLRRTPYFGQTKTHLAHLITAAAMNLVRLLRWVVGEQKAQPRHSVFAQSRRSPPDVAHPEFATNIKARKSHESGAASVSSNVGKQRFVGEP